MYILLGIFLIICVYSEKLAYIENDMGKFYYFRNEEHIGGSMKRGKIWEKHLLDIVKVYVEKSENIIDIGCHIGTHSISYVKMNSNVKVHSFEASPHTYEVLVKNVEVNKYENNIIPNNKAVGHRSMRVQMSNTIDDIKLVYDIDRYVNYGGLSLGIGGDEVDMISIDEYLQDKNIPINYMKIDVEGSEKLVIIGAKQTIEKYRPVILYEKNHCTLTKDMISSMYLTDNEINFNIEEYLESLNYNIKIIGFDVLATPK